MDNTLYLFVGKSASGKTTVANLLEQKYGLRQVNSYCTRPPRHEGETGHIFVTEDEFNNLNDMVAYTFYNNNHYGTTSEQIDKCDIYVVDVTGVETLLERYKRDREIEILYFSANICTRIHRMIDRGDSDMSIISRLLQDEKEDWHDKLSDIVWHHRAYYNRNVYLFDIYADADLTNVISKVERLMGVGT